MEVKNDYQYHRNDGEMPRFSGSIRVMQRPTMRQRRGLTMAAARRSGDFARKKKGRRGSGKKRKESPAPIYKAKRYNGKCRNRGAQKWISNNGVASMTGYALMKLIFSFDE